MVWGELRRLNRHASSCGRWGRPDATRRSLLPCCWWLSQFEDWAEGCGKCGVWGNSARASSVSGKDGPSSCLCCMWVTSELLDFPHKQQQWWRCALVSATTASWDAAQRYVLVTMCNFVADLPLPDSLWPALFVHCAGGSKASRSASPQWLQRWWRCAAPHNSLTHLDLPSLFIPQVGQRRGARFSASGCSYGSSVLPAHHRGALLVRLPDPRCRLGHAAVVCGAHEHVCCAGGCGRGGGVCSGGCTGGSAHSGSKWWSWCG